MRLVYVVENAYGAVRFDTEDEAIAHQHTMAPGSSRYPEVAQ